MDGCHVPCSCVRALRAGRRVRGPQRLLGDPPASEGDRPGRHSRCRLARTARGSEDQGNPLPEPDGRHIRCPEGVGGDAGPVACQEIAGRPDRGVVGGNTRRGRERAPRGCNAPTCARRGISIAPIVAKLGKPPTPEAIARRMSYSSASGDDRLRQDVRRAYDDAVHRRYRQMPTTSPRTLGRRLALRSPRRAGSVAPGTTTVATSSTACTRHSPRSRGAMRRSSGHASNAETRLQRRKKRRRGGRPALVRTLRRRMPRCRPRNRTPPSLRGHSLGRCPHQLIGWTSPRPGVPPSRPRPAPISGAGVPAVRYRSCLARCRDRPISGGGYERVPTSAPARPPVAAGCRTRRRRRSPARACPSPDAVLRHSPVEGRTAHPEERRGRLAVAARALERLHDALVFAAGSAPHGCDRRCAREDSGGRSSSSMVEPGAWMTA